MQCVLKKMGQLGSFALISALAVIVAWGIDTWISTANAQSEGTFLSFRSQSGDYIGGGQSLTKQRGLCSLAVLLKGRVKAFNVAKRRESSLQHLESSSQCVAPATIARKVQSGCGRVQKGRTDGSLIDARYQLLTGGCRHVEVPETTRR